MKKDIDDVLQIIADEIVENAKNLSKKSMSRKAVRKSIEEAIEQYHSSIVGIVEELIEEGGITTTD